MEKDTAIPIELEVWQKTSEYAIIEQYDDSMVVRFQYWYAVSIDYQILADNTIEKSCAFD